MPVRAMQARLWGLCKSRTPQTARRTSTVARSFRHPTIFARFRNCIRNQEAMCGRLAVCQTTTCEHSSYVRAADRRPALRGRAPDCPSRQREDSRVTAGDILSAIPGNEQEEDAVIGALLKRGDVIGE